MDILVFIPVLALVGLHLASLGGKRPSLKGAVAIWVIGLLLFAIARMQTPEQLLFRNSEAVKRVQSQLRHLKKQKGWETRPVIILEGSSLSLVGINGDLLEKKLHEAGKEATVLQFNMAGANHVERLNLLELFVDSLSKRDREKLTKNRVLLLSEVMRRYDEHPLVFLTKDEYAERARVYLEPDEAWIALQWQANELERHESVVLENVFANIFAIGAFSDMKMPGRIPGIGGYFPLKTAAKDFRFEAVSEISKSPAQGEYPFPWWGRYYETLRGKTGDWIDRGGFYGLPILDQEERVYQTMMAANLPPGTVMLQADGAAYERLAHADLWFDSFHVQEKGAEVMTEWLAEEIVRRWDELMGR